MYDELFPKTLDHYKGLIKVVYKDDPMIEIHPWAMHAAVDANCLAGQSGAAYWNYIDHVHQHVDEVTGQDRSVDKSNSFLDRLAEEEGTRSGLDGKSLRRCVTEQGESGIRASIIEAKDLQIDATPALFIGGERFTGAQPVELLWAAIDRALRAEGVVPPPNPYATTTNVRALTR
jgi:protein-disulfide isomerase